MKIPFLKGKSVGVLDHLSSPFPNLPPMYFLLSWYPKLAATLTLGLTLPLLVPVNTIFSCSDWGQTTEASSVCQTRILRLLNPLLPICGNQGSMFYRTTAFTSLSAIEGSVHTMKVQETSHQCFYPFSCTGESPHIGMASAASDGFTLVLVTSAPFTSVRY